MTKIEWAEESWNPLTGCTKISEGCKKCFAERMAKRLRGRYGYSNEYPFQVTFHYDKFEKPYTWKKPRRVFVCSMGDLFHEEIPFAVIVKVWDVMFNCSQHKFLILTKRPERVVEFERWMTEVQLRDVWYNNIWLGVTCENQKRANERIPILLQIPAKIRFVSVEPMLESLNLIWSLRPQLHPDLPCVDWVICGAETGNGARPCKLEWVQYLRNQCYRAEVPFFFKKFANGSRTIEGKLWEQYPNV